jgi:hypothetical protein
MGSGPFPSRTADVPIGILTGKEAGTSCGMGVANPARTRDVPGDLGNERGTVCRSPSYNG